MYLGGRAKRPPAAASYGLQGLLVRTQASIRWHQYWPRLQPPVVLHSGTAEQQLKGLSRKLQPGEHNETELL